MTSPTDTAPRTPSGIALLVTLAACNPTPAGPAPADINDPAATLARLASEPEGPARKQANLHRPPPRPRRARPPGARERPRPAPTPPSAPPPPSPPAVVTTERPSAPTLIALATSDPDSSVRVAASRGLANLRGAAAAFAPLQHNLSHETAIVHPRRAAGPGPHQTAPGRRPPGARPPPARRRQPGGRRRHQDRPRHRPAH